MGKSMYPKAQKTRSGNKVAWLYFADKTDAEKAREAALKEAQRMANNGYDFGFCAPGELREMKTGEYAGLFQVCIP